MVSNKSPFDDFVRNASTPIEDWLERLLSIPKPPAGEALPNDQSPERERSARNARLVFIVGFDYGELALFMYFALGQEFLNRTTLLLPDRLFGKNKDVLPGRTIPYGSLEEILTTINREKPDIVFLLSGYLFHLHGTLSLQSLHALTSELDQRGCHVVTSDPFMGLLSNLSEAKTGAIFTDDFPTHKMPLHILFWYAVLKLVKYRERRLHRVAFTWCVKILAGAWHIYPSPVPCERTMKTRNLSFYNSLLTTAPLEHHGRTSANAKAGVRHWLFIISSTDFNNQCFIHGRARFVQEVARRLEQSLSEDRRTLLLGPDECIKAIQQVSVCVPEMELLSFCSFKRFVSLLLGAEFVFYWNVVSASIGMRLFNQLPVFFFDRGHLAHAVKPSYELALKSYYHGFEPMFIDSREQLSAQTLTARADAYKPTAEKIRKFFARSPTPEQTVEFILRVDVESPHFGDMLRARVSGGYS
jgi:hypothetical protein